MASISESILKINLKGGCQATGWFFDSKTPYFLSSGHQFYNKEGKKILSDNKEYDVEYLGEVFNAKLIEVSYKEEALIDYSISIITSKIDSWKSLYITMPFEEVKGQKYELSGFADDHDLKLHLSINGKILDAFRNNKKGQNVELFQLSEDSEFDKKGISGSPVCIKKGGNYFATALLIQQSEYGNHTRMLAYGLHNLCTNKIVKDSLTRQSHQMSKVLKKNSMILQSPRYSLSLAPTESNKSLERNYEVFEEFTRLWGEFGVEKEKKLQQLDVNINFPNYIELKDEWINFRKNTSFIHEVQNKLKGEESLCRLIIDFTGTFNFNDVTETNLSHQIGIVIGNNNKVYSNPFYDLILEFDKKMNINDLIISIFNIAEDILLDINLFNSTRSTKYTFNTLKNKRLFSKLKVDYLFENNLSFYGRKIQKNHIRYIPINSMLRIDSIESYSIKDLNKLWSNFTKEVFLSSEIQKIIPQGMKLTYNRSKSNVIKVKDFYEIIKELKSLKKLGGQINIKNVKKQLLKFQGSSKLIFAITRKRPKTAKQKNSICQLMGRKNYRINMSNFFEVHRMNDLRKFSFCMYIVTFEIKR